MVLRGPAGCGDVPGFSKSEGRGWSGLRGVGGGEMKATFFCTSVAPVVAVEILVLRELRAAGSTIVDVAEETWVVSSD